MKTLKSLFTLCVFVTAFSVNAFGQETINATANVVNAITAGTPSPLDFGTILTTGTPSIAADSSAAGYVQYSGATEGQSVTIDITYPATLDNGASSFTFTASNLGIATNSGATPSAITVQGVTSGYSHTITSNGTNTNFFVTVGGSLAPSGTPVPGTYSGDIIVRTTYN